MDKDSIEYLQDELEYLERAHENDLQQILDYDSQINRIHHLTQEKKALQEKCRQDWAKIKALKEAIRRKKIKLETLHNDPEACLGLIFFTDSIDSCIFDHEGNPIDSFRIVAIRNDTDDISNTVACCACCSTGEDDVTGKIYYKISRNDFLLWSEDDQLGGLRTAFDLYEPITEEYWQLQIETSIKSILNNYSMDRWFKKLDVDWIEMDG